MVENSSLLRAKGWLPLLNVFGTVWRDLERLKPVRRTVRVTTVRTVRATTVRIVRTTAARIVKTTANETAKIVAQNVYNNGSYGQEKRLPIQTNEGRSTGTLLVLTKKDRLAATYIDPRTTLPSSAIVLAPRNQKPGILLPRDNLHIYKLQ